LDPHLTQGSLGSYEPVLKTAFRSVQQFWHSSHSCAPNTRRQTQNHSTYDICNNRPHLSTACRRCGL